jgi:oligosaccharide repeat unit polymerase
MLSLTPAFLGLVILASVLPVFRSRILNARGVFVAYMVSGALLPALVFVTEGRSLPTFVASFDNETIVYAIFLTFVFVVIALYLSTIFERYRAEPPGLAIYRPEPGTAIVFAILSLVGSLTYVVAMSNIFGGLSEFAIRAYQRVSFQSSTANALTIPYFLGYVFAVFAFTFSRRPGSSGAKALSILAVVLAIMASLLSGGRSMVILCLFSIAYPYLVRMRPGKLVIVGAAGLVLIGLISYQMVNARYVSQNATILQDQPSLGMLDLATTGLVFLDAVAAAVKYAHYYGYDFGQLYLNILGQPIPREIWSEKPLQISVRMRDFLFGDTLGGAPPGLIGESYIAFGLFGPLLIAPIYAWLMARVNRLATITAIARCPAAGAAAGILVPLIGFALIRGGFDIALIRIGIPAFWCLCAYWIARSTRQLVTNPLRLPPNPLLRPARTGPRQYRVPPR